jgi:predicted DNA-binding protein
LSKKKLWCLYLDIEQVEKLKELSTKTRVPQSVYIRDAIDLVLNRYAKKPRKKKVNNKIKHGKRTSLSLLKG